MKLTKRKGFNFFRSYYDVYNELGDREKVKFMDALLDRQFLGIKPTNLKGMSKFAYISQTNSIDSQVKGYEDKTNTTLLQVADCKEINTPTVGGTYGGAEPPTLQVQVEEKGKGELTLPDLETFMVYIKTYLKDDENRYDKVRQRMRDTYNGWKVNEWKDGNDKPIKNWKTKAIMQLRYI